MRKVVLDTEETIDWLLEYRKEPEFEEDVEKGGPGSGHRGHKGRKGKRGGSARSGVGGPPPGQVATEGPTAARAVPLVGEGPVILPTLMIDPYAITPHPKLSKVKVAHLRKMIDERKERTRVAEAKVAAAKSVGTVRKWAKRAAEHRTYILDYVAQLEGRK